MEKHFRTICIIFLACLAFALIAYGVYLQEPRLVPLIIGLLLWLDLSALGRKGKTP